MARSPKDVRSNAGLAMDASPAINHGSLSAMGDVAFILIQEGEGSRLLQCLKVKRGMGVVLDMTNLVVKLVTMKTMNVAEAKAHFSGVMQRVQQGETVVICNRNVPVARIVPIVSPGSGRQHCTQIGWAKGDKVRILGDVTEPALPESDWGMLQ